MVKVIKFLLYIFKSLFQILDFIPTAISLMITAIGIMPTALVGLCTLALTILVIYAIVGRGS